MISSPDITTLPALMRATASRFTARLLAVTGMHSMPTPVLPPHDTTLRWENTLLRHATLRRCHVELFEIPDHFAVLHVCLMPHPFHPGPIFGFDMVAGTAQATGLFLDFSPTIPGPPVPALRDILPAQTRRHFQHPRPLPAWGDIFSDDFFAIRPVGMAEAHAAIAIAETALDHYLLRVTALSQANSTDAMSGQAAYARAQRRNPHTFKMLARHVGAQPARDVIDRILFPMPDEYRPLPEAADALA
jgi:phycocyanobilin:ferredoxin oxidoreductase